MDELPGPPFNQIVRGAFLGSLRASKNQKNCEPDHQSFSSGVGRAAYAINGVILSLSQVCGSRRKVNMSGV
jgi:hypothetical protein